MTEAVSKATPFTETDAFKRADERVRKTFMRAELWHWRAIFQTVGYAPACEAIIAIEGMNTALFDDEQPPVSNISWKVSPDGGYLYHELLFDADDETAKAVVLQIKGSAVPGSGHCRRLTPVR